MMLCAFHQSLFSNGQSLRLEETALHFHSSFYKPTTIELIKYKVHLRYTAYILGPIITDFLHSEKKNKLR